MRKFLAGFASIIPFVKINSNSHSFGREDHALRNDWVVVGEDLNLAISKHNKNIKNNERQ